MDHFSKLKRQVQIYIFVFAISTVVIMVGTGWLLRHTFPGHDDLVSLLLLIGGLFVAIALSYIISNYALKPLGLVWRAVLHVSPGHSDTVAPNIEQNNVGKELVTSLALQVYQLASNQGSSLQETSNTISALAQSIVNNMPVPVIVLDNQQTIRFMNENALKYTNTTQQNTIGNNLYNVLDFMFQDENTFDAWLQNCRTNKAVETNRWERVRLKSNSLEEVKQLDMAAYYTRESTTGLETIISLFDETERYNADDQSLNFIALAVHELRTPLTVLRGYIEVFEDELGEQLPPDMQDFMHKMNASAQQLAAFVSNILNVARVEENQLILQLTEENWTEILKTAIADISLRAQVHNKSIEYSVDASVPTVGVDKVSIFEVINNLVDNAIKYSAEGSKIVIHTYLTQDGMVETTVSDSGIGIPESVMPHLFEKFERNHRTRAQVGGTGLGLYLSKAIITAHGGHIWVKSKENEGSTFGFTLQPYAQLADELKNSDNKDIVRGAHGWIKNHSLYRR